MPHYQKEGSFIVISFLNGIRLGISLAVLLGLIFCFVPVLGYFDYNEGLHCAFQYV